VFHVWWLRIHPTMSKDDPAERALRAVAARARSTMEIVDWREFYNFIATAASCRKRWTMTHVRQRLLEMNVPEERANELSEIYGHCRCAIYWMGTGSHKQDTQGWSLFLT
jgi:hypothetical protein